MANLFKKVLVDNSFRVMLSGFGISAVGLFSYVYYMYKDPGMAKIAFSAAIAGFCVYVIGRICLFIKNKNQTKTPEIENEVKDSV
jgi:hypothetical protein